MREMIYYVSGTAYITSDAHNSLKPPSLRVKGGPEVILSLPMSLLASQRDTVGCLSPH